MSEVREIKIGKFLFERKDRYKPVDKAVSGLKRIEKIDFQGVFHIGEKPSNTGMILVKPGDFVISGINVTKGAMGIYAGDEDVAATIHYSSYTFNEVIINVGYFKRFLKSKVFIDLLKEQVKGGIKTEIKPKHILPLKIFLPDKSVQDEIVKHFENIEGDISDLATQITRQQTLLKKLRQSILQDAISGKLTAQSRKENPGVEPASELLKRIKAEKDRLVKEKKIPKQKPLSPITDAEIPFELPGGWVWCRLGEIGFITGGGTPSKDNPSYWDGDIPWICPKDMKMDFIEKSIFQITNEGVNNSSAKMIPTNSILFVVRGMILLHTFPIAINTKEATVNQDMKALIPHIDGMQCFLLIALKASSKYILRKVRRSTHGTCRLESVVYENLLIPVPPKEEQKKIVLSPENRIKRTL